MFKSAFLILLITISFSLFSQIEIKGKVIDSQTRKALSFCSIAIENTSRGVIANEDGEFSIEVENEQVVLIISYVGYEERRMLALNVLQNPTLYLKTSEVNLQAVVIRADDDYLYDLLEKVRKNLISAEASESKAYLRVQHDDTQRPIELMECYYNAKSSSNAVQELKLKNGRAGMRIDEESAVFRSLSTSKFFEFFDLTVRQDYLPDIPFQMGKARMKKLFGVNQISVGLDSITQISFKPREDDGSKFSGDVWIDLRNYHLRKLELHVDKASTFPLVGLDENDYLDDKRVNYIMNFQNLEGKSVLSHVNFEYSFHYVRGTVGSRDIRAKGILYFFDYSDPFILPLYSYNDDWNDYNQINLLSLNSEFWKLNHGLPLTKIELQKIAYFGQKGLLLNYRTQDDQHERGQDSVGYTIASIVWSDKKRVSVMKQLRTIPPPRQVGPGEGSNSFKFTATNTYNIEVQLFLDINKVADSVQYYSATVMDVPHTYYYSEKHPFTDLFFNLYFDICEIERRRLVEEIENGPKKAGRLKRLNKEAEAELEEILEKFVDDTSHGRNIRGLTKWSKYVNEKLGINNPEILGVGFD